jgi:hypothetical protein
MPQPLPEEELAAVEAPVVSEAKSDPKAGAIKH